MLDGKTKVGQPTYCVRSWPWASTIVGSFISGDEKTVCVGIWNHALAEDVQVVEFWPAEDVFGDEREAMAEGERRAREATRKLQKTPKRK
jgi:hypothetical protein